MPNGTNKYCWRCAKCNNHFANIENMNGQIVIEKKCAKCKAENKLVLLNNEIRIQCKLYNSERNDYEKIYEKEYSNGFNGH